MPNAIDRALTDVINARGVFTPLGVSRSAPSVSDAAAYALGHHFIMDDLHDTVAQHIVKATGAPCAAVVHCVAAAVTLAVAACMTGTSSDLIAQLPDTTGLKNRVVLPRSHAVNYGHPIEQAVRLAGAKPVLVGTPTTCDAAHLAQACTDPAACCLLLVSSRLTTSSEIDFASAIATAHAHNLPVVIDGAAQDLRIADMLATGADAVLVSGQKYLAAPTSGLVLGRADLIQAVRAQEKGIGRGMKTSKEALLGVYAAITLRAEMNLTQWRADQARKVAYFVNAANQIHGITAKPQPDPTDLPFERAHLCFAPRPGHRTAAQISADLKAGSPSIWTMDHLAAQDELVFELVQLNDAEMDVILDSLRRLSQPTDTQ